MGVFEKLKRFMGLEKNESAFEEEHEAEDKLQRAEKENKNKHPLIIKIDRRHYVR